MLNGIWIFMTVILAQEKPAFNVVQYSSILSSIQSWLNICES